MVLSFSVIFLFFDYTLMILHSSSIIKNFLKKLKYLLTTMDEKLNNNKIRYNPT